MGTVELNSAYFALIALMVTLGGVLWTLFRMVADAGNKQAPVIEAARKELSAEIEGARRELAAEIDKQVAINDRGRHDLRNTVQNSFTKVETDLDRLKREAVRREDMSAIETRLTAMLAKMETKLDKMGEHLSDYKALEKQVGSMDARLGVLAQPSRDEAVRGRGGQGAGRLMADG